MASTKNSIPNGTTDEELEKLKPLAEAEEENGPLVISKQQKGGKEVAIVESDAPREGQGLGRKPFNYATLLKYTSLLVLVVQNTSQVLVMRYATTRDHQEHPPFLKTVAVFLNEVVKLFAALVLFFFSTGDFKRSLSLLRHHFITNFFDTLKVGVPAFIYVIQNFLLYVAVENLDAGTYMVTYQLKILTTAMFTVLMLKRKLSVQQWIALLILIAGVAIVQISANQKSSSYGPEDGLLLNLTSSTTLSPISSTLPSLTASSSAEDYQQSPIIGFTTIIVACFLSGFAGIYFEKILKGSNVSVWLRNTQLAALSIPIGLAVICIKDWQKVHAKGFMQGFDIIVWAVVLLQALGGLVVAVVIKYADNILKAFATSISIMLATVASIFIFAIYPKLLFIGGAVLVIGAVVLYGTFPYKRRRRNDLEEGNSLKQGEEMRVLTKGGKEQKEEEEKDIRERKTVDTEGNGAEVRREYEKMLG